MATVIDWAERFMSLIDLYHEQHNAAPMYSYKSRITKTKVLSKYSIKMEFIDNLTEMSVLCDDAEVNGKIDKLIQKYERA